MEISELFTLSVLVDVILTFCYHQPDKSKTWQLTTKQSRWIKSATGEKKYLSFWGELAL